MPCVEKGNKVVENSIVGEVEETKSIVNKIMVPIGIQGKIIEIATKGEYTVTETIAKIEKNNGEIVEITMCQNGQLGKEDHTKKDYQLTNY